MSGPATTHIPGAQGQFHTGTGHFFSIGTALFKDSKGRDPRAVARDELLHLHQRYVHPPGFGRARTILDTERTVLLDGAPGNGRNAAARMLLYELRNRAQTFRELLANEEEDATSRLPLDGIGDGDLLLLDLSSVDERLWREVHGELSALRETVCRQAAHLVIVLPHSRVERLRNELDAYRCAIARPRETQVVRRHLRLEGIPAANMLQFPSALNEFLSSDRMLGEIAAFSRLIISARDSGQVPGGFSEWCEHAQRAADDWGKDVAQLVTDIRTGPERALILATAMLHGSHADVVERGAAALLRTTKYPEDDTPLLERAHLPERFEKISVTRAADGTVRFGKVDFDKAVRRHFWDHVPGLRENLRDWTIATAAKPELPDFECDRLVARFSRECLRTGHVPALETLVLQCASAPTGSAQLRAAAYALEHGLNDAQHARSFRRFIYEWSRKTGLSRGLVQVLVLVCAEVMSVRHPDQAVTRLLHLARREQGGTAARDALLDLVRSDHRLHRRMLDRLARDVPQGAWPVDTDLFLDLTDPVLLTSAGPGSRPRLTDRGLRRGLTMCWNALFKRLPHHLWEEQVRRWFTTASENEEHADLLLDVLVNAAERRGGTLARLYVIARHWVQPPNPVPGSRDTLVTRLFQKINAAQGLRAA
ncbi:MULTISPECIES: hypothetical protein [Streptomyces]|uniref:Uncharacterized protein n=2 Tax=Streptomyces TaxID=1883 RepID=A0A3R7FHD7_9ACTN|nr:MULTISPECIES: hypothetical protein [Streptomyces]KNE83463.1 hypothetical protein ADZ36_05115 [Streptomyces fradiae]OFA61945.1 hypothetical protein BEN35_00485 [Streptomyces fradiae]PQM24267.1 hypothetical protein Sfr7A_05625 [Streptomyces xinghaiensis]RKM97232.1 hypothetical protein SFRA_008315 [Streptomyces xinghaiensis]RNC75373.1 hypothetical protein DC095_006285 [Streptomyces xinghaiensis]